MFVLVLKYFDCYAFIKLTALAFFAQYQAILYGADENLANLEQKKACCCTTAWHWEYSRKDCFATDRD